MVEPTSIVVPRESGSSASKGDTTQVTRQLPDDLVSEQVERLSLFCLVTGGLWLFGLLLGQVLMVTFPMAHPVDVRTLRVIEVLGVIASSVMFAYLRYARHSSQIKTEVSLFYLIVNAAGIAALNTWVAPPPAQPNFVQVSWIAILVLVYSTIAPAAPRKMLAASLVAASLDPLGVWFAHLRGMPVPTAVQTMVLFWPNYAAALLTIVPAHLVHRLGRQLRKARELGSYRLVRLLGQGGMGEVWEAQHRLLARKAAVKLVRPEVLGAASDAQAKTMLKRFEREAQATASLSSPHTIQVFDFGMTEQGVFYYVMELLAGRDLESLVRKFGPLPAARASYLLRQVSHSLADAHARGFVHRDIKPANIYVCRMGLEYDFVKVLDFGLVKVNGQSALRTQTMLTGEQRTSGTPAYMAPEIILGETNVDRRADVYALGCVAYYLLTGQLVFAADTPMKMLIQHVQAEPVPPSQRTELPIPADLEAFVLACLQKNPDKRPQDAQVLFEMVCGCSSRNAWNPELAEAWWQKHLPEFTGPLVLGDFARQGAGSPAGEAGHIQHV